ncbi:MAG: hydrogenase iron-sulfur subunit [Clostridia bacterium]|jgi:coenzyme F420-reducing hydrogenase delta subunit|nr:hydrogenase iron-sulfur subunit [Clostridia bacterium]MDH7572810.1 hydrogenase iron-sulfur subunit [Clostridia bacterium]
MERGSQFRPKILGFLCNWCAYGGADLCGVSRYQYPPYLRVVRVMCSGRVDMGFVLRAFQNGMDGVFVGGCWPGECHYITEGNYDALAMMHLTKKLLREIGINPERMRLAWVSASEGVRFAEIMNEFSAKVRELGPLGKGEGLDPQTLAVRLEAAAKLVPYIRLVERERLRPPVRTEEAYNEFFTGEEADRIFKELVVSRLVENEVMLLLRKGPRSAGDICGALGLTISEALGYVNPLVRDGLVRYDVEHNRFALA